MAISFHDAAQQLKASLQLKREPIAISFLKEAPTGVSRFKGEVPAGCSFWTEANDKAFYTVAEDHYNCPIGTLTQGFEIPQQRAAEAQELFACMIDNKYLTSKEFENVPKIKSSPKIVMYSPLAQVNSEPDVVLLTCSPYQAMLLSEATAEGGESFPPLMGRPTCAAIPHSLDTEKAVLSLGCIGNRVYTGLAPDEMVFTAPGKNLEKIMNNLQDITKANTLLEGIHTSKKQEIIKKQN